jgi:uncharacterized protein YdhG (YjbR/CyaY superfamily)
MKAASSSPKKKHPAARSGLAAVSAYLASRPPDVRAGLVELRKAIAAAVPGAEEGISYGIPAFKLNGRPVVWFAAFKDHCSFFPAATAIRLHAAELKGYKISKGTIQFPHGKPPPAKLVSKLVKTRLAELVGAKG